VRSVKQNSVNLDFCLSYLGTSYESYTMELLLTDSTFPQSVVHHDLPYFVPVQQILAANSTVAKETACQQFVWSVYRYLHAYVARRQETVLAKVSLFVC